MDEQQQARRTYHLLATEETRLLRESSALLRQVVRIQQEAERLRQSLPWQQEAYDRARDEIFKCTVEHQKLRPLIDEVQAQIKEIFPRTMYTLRRSDPPWSVPSSSTFAPAQEERSLT